MVPEDLLFWIAPMSGTPHEGQKVLCLRHADTMSVPRGWTLDDRREEIPRLFMPRKVERSAAAAQTRRRRRASHPEPVEQLVIDGTGEIERPSIPADPESEAELAPAAEREVPPDPGPDDGAEPAPDVGPGSWLPTFDQDSDLNGLLEVTSPLLARAFRGTDRQRS
jgi:hypothetical protein